MASDRESGAGRGASGSLEPLLEAVRRTAAAYRAAESAASDHRVRAAVACLRRDHERHSAELAGVVAEGAARARLADGGAERHPVVGAVRRGVVVGSGLVDAIRRSELALARRYRARLERGYGEPLQAMLRRHLRVEEEHLGWLDESRWWRRIGGTGAGPADAAAERRG